MNGPCLKQNENRSNDEHGKFRQVTSAEATQRVAGCLREVSDGVATTPCRDPTPAGVSTHVDGSSSGHFIGIRRSCASGWTSRLLVRFPPILFPKSRGPYATDLANLAGDLAEIALGPPSDRGDLRRSHCPVGLGSRRLRRSAKPENRYPLPREPECLRTISVPTAERSIGADAQDVVC